MQSKKSTLSVIIGIGFTIAALALGYLALGIWAALLFTFGYVVGLLLWLASPGRISFREIALPYFLTLGLFVVHKIEEREKGFFPAFSELTGVKASDPGSIPAILLYGIACVWLLIPFLVRKQRDFGYYLVCTFFASMGILELSHFVFPVFRDAPYSYFPGMWSVILLAPSAWWGLWKLFSGNKKM